MKRTTLKLFRIHKLCRSKPLAPPCKRCSSEQQSQTKLDGASRKRWITKQNFCSRFRAPISYCNEFNPHFPVWDVLILIIFRCAPGKKLFALRTLTFKGNLNVSALARTAASSDFPPTHIACAVGHGIYYLGLASPSPKHPSSWLCTVCDRRDAMPVQWYSYRGVWCPHHLDQASFVQQRLGLQQ